jgi:hypothetical protein
VKTNRKKIKQKIVATLVVLFMFAMIFGSVNLESVRAIGSNTTLSAVISAGSLALESPASASYGGITLSGVAQNTTANLTQVNMRDTRGSGAGWSAIGSANNMYKDATNNISNIYVSWAPGTIYALDGASNTGVAAGASYSGNFGDGTRPLANTSTNNGMGNYVINGTICNLHVLSSVLAGTYVNTLTLTIS